jgi:hypothetical protein
MTISYRRNRSSRIDVYLDRKWIGSIKPAQDASGFFYQPKSTGAKIRGDIFPTIAEVKRSLEGDGS